MSENELTPEELDKKYIDNPNICPFCKSSSISVDHTEMADLYAHVECLHCGAEWNENFELVGITDIERPDPPWPNLDGKYQCCTCEKFFDILPEDKTCPHCGSGNWVEGCIDDEEDDVNDA